MKKKPSQTNEPRPLSKHDVSNSADYEPFGAEWEKEVTKLNKAHLIDMIRRMGQERLEFKEKYYKCIEVIKRFDAGIIGMYDL